MSLLGGLTGRGAIFAVVLFYSVGVGRSEIHAQTRAIQLAPSVPEVQPPVAPPESSTTSTAPKPESVPASENGNRDADAGDAWLQQIAQRQQQVLADTERTPEVKEQLNKAYEQLRLDWDSAIKAHNRSQEYSDAALAAPGLLETTKTRQAELEANKSNNFSQELSSLSYEELDQKRLALEAELTTLSTERTTLTESISKRDKRRKDLPPLISDAKSQLEQIGLEPPNGTASEDPLVKEASAWSFEVARKLLGEQQQSFEAEQRLYEAEAALLPLQLELAQATEKQTRERLRLVNEQLDKIRANRILNTLREARNLIADTPEGYKVVGEQLLLHIETWKELADKQASLKSELEEAQRLLDRWSERRTQMDARVESKPGPKGVSNVITGFNSWVGLMLRKQRSELPDPQQLRAKLNIYQNEMQSIESLLFDIQDLSQEIELKQEILESRTIPNVANQEVEGGEDLGTQETAEERAAGDLLKFSTRALQMMKLDVNAYQDDLYGLADIRERTIRLTNGYREFIDKHVLWIRSTDRLSPADFRPGVEAFSWLTDVQNWREVSSLFGRDALEQPGWTILFLVIMALLIGNQSRFRRRLAELSSKAEKNNCTDFRLTVRCLILTLFISAPVTLLLVYLQVRLASATGGSGSTTVGTDFSTALSASLRLMAIVFFPLELLRQVCRPDGLGVKHFGWKAKIVLKLRNNLRWLINGCVPLAGIVGMFLNHSAQRWESSMGRAAFIALMLLLSIFLIRVLAPRSGMFSDYLLRHPGGWVDRLSWLWYPAACLYPLALAAVSFVGYHYTAQRIATHMITTKWTIVVEAICYFMLLRWLVLKRRRLMLAQARQRLEDAAKREPGGEVPVTVEGSRIDLVAINEQTRRLVTSFMVTIVIVSLFVIWSDVLPAVAMLEGIRLRPLQGEVTEDTFKITLAGVLVVIPIVLLFVISGRNVPGLLEIALLQHLPLTNAARYAITTLSRYAIFALGVIVVASIIGLHWESIQWLVAALGVGLGFGLQEIFANFVSGLILLFEQPIRVGDIVSVDGTTGSVSKIRMRATTIVNWDRQELIVPNKDFITGKLLNWTLTDSTNRIVINVGVAYGSDTRQACTLMMQVCQDHPNVLKDPLPSVTFEGFGDNSLSLVLRAFLDSLEIRLATIHELHQQIYQSFNEAGIEIAFPQRDLHLRTLPEKLSLWLDRESR